MYPVRPRFQWLHVYGFAHPNSGRSFWLLLPTVSIVAFNLAVQAFADFVQPSDSHRVSLLIDNAAWHTSPLVNRPHGLDFNFLSPYSPELQPAEHLWALSDVPLVNRCFESLTHLEKPSWSAVLGYKTSSSSAIRFPWWLPEC